MEKLIFGQRVDFNSRQDMSLEEFTRIHQFLARRKAEKKELHKILKDIYKTLTK
jgi:hypothetical protein